MPRSCSWPVLWRLRKPCRTSTKRDVLFITEDWDTKVGSQEIPGVTGKFGLRVQNEAGKRLTEFGQENMLVITKTLFQQHKRWLYTWTSPNGQFQNQIDYILCSQRWSQQKEGLELTVAQIMNSLLKNSCLNLRNEGKPLGKLGMTKSKHFLIHSGGDE